MSTCQKKRPRLQTVDAIKQVVGIDVDKANLVVQLGRLNRLGFPELYASKIFANSHKGFKALVLWVSQRTNPEVPVFYVMEATGVYHEALALYLDELGLKVSVVLPTKISFYAKSLDPKTITDQLSAQAIVRYGLQTKLKFWQRPSLAYQQLRSLTRERDQIISERTDAKNKLHAYAHQGIPQKGAMSRLKARISLLQKQQDVVMDQIKQLCTEQKELAEPLAFICSIPGVGLLTGAIMLAETHGFALFTSRRQLSSYAGFDVIQKISGSSVRTRAHISKRGNKYLRKALYMPAMSSAQHAPEQRAIYARLVAKHAIKSKAAVAVQRRVLELAYTLVKNGTYYDPAYQIKRAEGSL
jgi:transposase